MFTPIDFSRLNETDVRETVCVELLRRLGYERGSSAHIITEQTIRDPRISLGRRKPTDPELRGRADYILEVDQKLRWIMEVKSPSNEITIQDREQTYSYATHPEIKAIFYAITNGRSLELHLARVGPRAEAIFVVTYSELAARFMQLSNIVSPESLRRDFPDYVVDTGEPLAPGLRSFAQLRHGSFRYTGNTHELSSFAIVDRVTALREGAVERMSNGQIIAYLKFYNANHQMDDIMRSLGLDVFEITSNDRTISQDAALPSVFSSRANWDLPRGLVIPHPLTNQKVPLPVPVKVETNTVAQCHLYQRTFKGTFTADVVMKSEPPMFSPMKWNGVFEFGIS